MKDLYVWRIEVYYGHYGRRRQEVGYGFSYPIGLTEDDYGTAASIKELGKFLLDMPTEFEEAIFKKGCSNLPTEKIEIAEHLIMGRKAVRVHKPLNSRELGQLAIELTKNLERSKEYLEERKHLIEIRRSVYEST